MDMNIADTIRVLRKERGLTQEAFARAIGVTTQAVSRWERGEGYPDITLLPPIAQYFHVTLDTLFGMDEQRKKEEIISIINATSDTSGYEDGVRIAREGLAKFPGEALLQNNLARALMGCTDGFTPSRQTLLEVVGLYESILLHCPDASARFPDLLSSLCQACVLLGEYEKAKQIALKIDGKYENRQAWCRILKGEELVFHIQNGIIQTLPDLHFMTMDLLKSDCYTVKEKIKLCQKMIGVYALFDECSQWPVGLIFSYRLYVQIALLSMKMGETDRSFEALENAAALAVRTDLLPKEGFPSSLLLNRINFGDLSGELSERACLYDEIEEEEAFSALRETPEYKRILEKLKDLE